MKFMRMEKKKDYSGWKGHGVVLRQDSQSVLVRQGGSHFRVHQSNLIKVNKDIKNSHVNRRRKYNKSKANTDKRDNAHTSKRVRIKCIAIAKCDLFLHYRDARKSHFTIFVTQNFLQNTKKPT